MTDDVAGTVVADRFELHERIDSGGLATVWRGTDLDTDAPVAVKRERDEVHDREQVRAHFRQELRWFRRFEDGPTPGSLVHFVDGSVGDGSADDDSVDDGDSYVVTELVDGGSIDDYFEGEATPGRDAFRTVGGPVCRALAFLHENGVLHLDLKPGNVLNRRRGPPAVIDLNSAVPREAGTDTLFHFDPFKPPELTPTDARDEPVGPWSDVYALGAFLAFLLTGESVPRAEPTLDEWRPVDIESGESDRPPELVDALRRATAPRPDERFDDAGELYAALVPHFDPSDRSDRSVSPGGSASPDGSAPSEQSAPSGRSASLVHEPTGHAIRIHPGDTLGRWTADRWIPTVVLPDDDRFLSPNHVVFEWEGGSWFLRDRSLNGTYVSRGTERTYVLSREGRDRRREADAPLGGSEPNARTRLADGDRIAPVNPAYAGQLAFRTG